MVIFSLILRSLVSRIFLQVDIFNGVGSYLCETAGYRLFIVMRKLFILLSVVLLAVFPASLFGMEGYPEIAQRKKSPGGMRYYIDPVKGSNEGTGEKSSPWKSFAPLNRLILAPGDRVEVVSAGELRDSFFPAGRGTAEKPIVVNFSPGRYDWFSEGLLTRKLAISNTNDVPDGDKAIAMELSGISYFEIKGEGALFFCRGKMTQIHFDHSANIKLSGFGFDYKRPTMSEYTVDEAGDKEALISIHKDSDYTIENGKVIWVGEGWRNNAEGYGQTFVPDPVTLYRSGSPLGGINKAEEVEPDKVKVFYEKNPGFTKGLTYQHRDTRRDYSGVFCNRSENITYAGLKFHYMHGMGVVSQFSRNLLFKDITFAPRKESGRTIAAWADMLHFSGCGGKIVVNKVHFFGANDDAINIHGTYLRIIESLPPNQIKVKFMHGQTYGFPAFTKGDKVEFVRERSLLTYAAAAVKEAKMLNEREMLLTLDKKLPDNMEANDVLENVTWTPEVEIKNCLVEAIPTRGFLISTRKPVLVEGNVFRRTKMSALLMAGDASSWFESGKVSNLTIKNNVFDHCEEPVINFHPENREGQEGQPVHSNIKIVGNTFLLKGRGAISLKSTEKVTVSGNKFILDKKGENLSVQDLIQRHASAPVKASNNIVE